MERNVPQNSAHLPHYLHELPQEDEERLGKLFNSLDLDGNGKIDIHDLSVALKEFGVSHRDAQVKITISYSYSICKCQPCVNFDFVFSTEIHRKIRFK